MITISKKSLRRALMVGILPAALTLTAACSQQVDNPYEAAVKAIDEGDYQAGRLLLSQVLKADAKNNQARLLYGKVQLMLDNPEGAIVEFKAILNDPDYAVEANALLAKSYLQSGNTKLALETLETGGMTSGLAYAVSVVASLSEGEADKAVAMLDEGLASFPDSPDLIVLDAKRAYDMRDVAKARGMLSRVFEQEPNHIEARLLAGRLEMHERKFDKAEQHFGQALKSNPWNIPAILSMVAISRDRNDSKAADEWLEKAKEIAPGHPIGVYFAAQMAFDSGEYNDAHMLVQSLNGSQADFPALRLLRGLISARMGQTHTAISEFERFFRLGGENDVARVILAGQYRKAGNKQKAWDMIEPVLASANADAGTLKLGAELAGELGNPRQSELANRARTAGTKLPYAKKMAEAGTAIRAGQWMDADKLYRQILAEGGETNAVVLNNAANVRLKLGKKAEALVLARKAYALAPHDPMIMDTLGWVLVQTDSQSAEGRQLISRAVELAPNNAAIADHWIGIPR